MRARALCVFWLGAERATTDAAGAARCGGGDAAGPSQPLATKLANVTASERNDRTAGLNGENLTLPIRSVDFDEFLQT